MENINNISIIIVLIILSFGILGLKRGVIKEAAVVLGNIAAIILAFLLKGLLANFLINLFPPFRVNSVFGPLSSLSIIFYQLIAFLVLLIIFHFILRIIVSLSGIISKIVDATVILILPNRIFGFVLGIIEGYIIMFIVLNVLMIPLSSNDDFMNSKVRKSIMEDTPVLKDSFGGINTTLEEIMALDKSDSKNSLNLKVIDILLKNKIVTVDEVKELETNKKIIDINNLDTVTNKYEG